MRASLLLVGENGGEVERDLRSPAFGTAALLSGEWEGLCRLPGNSCSLVCMRGVMHMLPVCVMRDM